MELIEERFIREEFFRNASPESLLNYAISNSLKSVFSEHTVSDEIARALLKKNERLYDLSIALIGSNEAIWELIKHKTQQTYHTVFESIEGYKKDHRYVEEFYNDRALLKAILMNPNCCQIIPKYSLWQHIFNNINDEELLSEMAYYLSKNTDLRSDVLESVFNKSGWASRLTGKNYWSAFTYFIINTNESTKNNELRIYNLAWKRLFQEDYPYWKYHGAEVIEKMPSSIPLESINIGGLVGNKNAYRKIGFILKILLKDATFYENVVDVLVEKISDRDLNRYRKWFECNPCEYVRTSYYQHMPLPKPFDVLDRYLKKDGFIFLVFILKNSRIYSECNASFLKCFIDRYVEIDSYWSVKNAYTDATKYVFKRYSIEAPLFPLDDPRQLKSSPELLKIDEVYELLQNQSDILVAAVAPELRKVNDKLRDISTVEVINDRNLQNRLHEQLITMLKEFEKQSNDLARVKFFGVFAFSVILVILFFI